jgi:hypothetical protein
MKTRSTFNLFVKSEKGKKGLKVLTDMMAAIWRELLLLDLISTEINSN